MTRCRTIAGSRAAALAAVAAMAASLVGCATQCAENFHALHAGMTKPEVRDLLGEPSSVWPIDVPTSDGSPSGAAERWQYGDSLSSLATGSLFHDADSSRVWAVWFGPDGRVDFYRAPDWAAE